MFALPCKNAGLPYVKGMNGRGFPPRRENPPMIDKHRTAKGFDPAMFAPRHIQHASTLSFTTGAVLRLIGSRRD